VINGRNVLEITHREIDTLSSEVQMIKMRGVIHNTYQQSLEQMINSLEDFRGIELRDEGGLMNHTSRIKTYRPRNHLVDYDLDNPNLILEAASKESTASSPVQFEAEVTEEDMKAYWSRQSLGALTPMTAALQKFQKRKTRHALEDDADSEDDVEDVEDSLVFGNLSPGKPVSNLIDEDLPENMLREMVFNEYWALVGGRYKSVKQSRKAAVPVSPRLMDDERVMRSPKKKSAFDMERLAAYKNAVDTSSDEDEETTAQQEREKVTQILVREEGAAIPVPQSSSWQSDPIEVRLMSISMTRDPELEEVDARLPQRTRSLATRKKAATRLSFSGTGLNFKNVRSL
jgi:hypothetical protein